MKLSSPLPVAIAAGALAALGIQKTKRPSSTLATILVATGASIIAAALAVRDSRLFLLDNVIMVLVSPILARLLRTRSAAEVATFRETGNGIVKQSEALGNVVETVRVPVEGSEIDVYIHRPKSLPSCNLPLIVWFHGGGMCLGTPHDGAMGWPGFGVLSHFKGVAVVASVGYRLAPEHPFPTGAEDAVAATHWLQKNAAQYGCDPGRVCVAGASAGGSLAAIVHQAASIRGFPLICAVIVTPMIRYGATTMSHIENGTDFGLTTNCIIWFWNTFCPDKNCAADPRCEPIRGIAAALSSGQLAPCLIATAEFDVLRDEGEEYFEALRDAGVQATHLRFYTTHFVPSADKERFSQLMRWWSGALGTNTTNTT